MEWGQSGSYNAPDDRRALTAMMAGRAAGVVSPVVLTAGSGLNINVAANWLAVVNCADQTLGVAGTASALVVPGNAGDAGAPRTDSLWCDVSPTAGTFALVVIPQSAETGRIGIRLATLTVPTGANLASAFTMTPVAASAANWPNGLNIGAVGALWTVSPYLGDATFPNALRFQQGSNPPIFMLQNGQVRPASLITPTAPESWHAITLSGSWANVAGQGLEMMYTADDFVHIHGSITVPSGVTGPANTIAVLNSLYRPARYEDLFGWEVAVSSPYTATAHDILVRPGGQLDCFGAAVAGTTIRIDSRYPLHGTVFP